MNIYNTTIKHVITIDVPAPAKDNELAANDSMNINIPFLILYLSLRSLGKTTNRYGVNAIAKIAFPCHGAPNSLNVVE